MSYFNVLDNFRYSSTLDSGKPLLMSRYDADALEAEGMVAEAIYPKTRNAAVKVTLTEEGMKRFKRDLEIAEHFFDRGFDSGRDQGYHDGCMSF